MSSNGNTSVRPIVGGLCLALCASLGAVAPAVAKPVKITFSSTITHFEDDLSPIPGITVGDAFIIDFIADNGESGLIGQSWTLANVQSATVRSGSFSVTYTGNWWTEDDGTYGPAGWETNDAGVLSYSQFYGLGDPSAVCPESSPALACQYWLSADNIQSVHDGSIAAFFKDGWSGYDELYPQGRWSISEVPLPGTLPLLGAGLLALGLLRRRD